MGPWRRDGLRVCTPGGFCSRRRQLYPVALGSMCVGGWGGGARTGGVMGPCWRRVWGIGGPEVNISP